MSSLFLGLEYLDRSPNLDEMELGCLGTMKDSATFMRDTLNDVLSIQRIEEGKLELEMSLFSVQESFGTVVSALQGSLSRKKLKVELNICAAPALVEGDNHRIQVRRMDFFIIHSFKAASHDAH